MQSFHLQSYPEIYLADAELVKALVTNLQTMLPNCVAQWLHHTTISGAKRSVHGMSKWCWLDVWPSCNLRSIPDGNSDTIGSYSFQAKKCLKLSPIYQSHIFGTSLQWYLNIVLRGKWLQPKGEIDDRVASDFSVTLSRPNLPRQVWHHLSQIIWRINQISKSEVFMRNLCKSWKHRRLDVNALLNFEKPHYLKPLDLEDFEGVGCVEAVTRAGARSVFWIWAGAGGGWAWCGAILKQFFHSFVCHLFSRVGLTLLMDSIGLSLFFGVVCLLGFFTRNAFFRWQSHTAEVEAEPHRPRDPPHQGVHLAQITNKGLWTEDETIKWLTVKERSNEECGASHFWAATLFRHLVCWPPTSTTPRRKKGLLHATASPKP